MSIHNTLISVNRLYDWMKDLLGMDESLAQEFETLLLEDRYVMYLLDVRIRSISNPIIDTGTQQSTTYGVSYHCFNLNRWPDNYNLWIYSVAFYSRLDRVHLRRYNEYSEHEILR